MCTVLDIDIDEYISLQVHQEARRSRNIKMERSPTHRAQHFSADGCSRKLSMPYFLNSLSGASSAIHPYSLPSCKEIPIVANEA